MFPLWLSNLLMAGYVPSIDFAFAASGSVPARFFSKKVIAPHRCEIDPRTSQNPLYRDEGTGHMNQGCEDFTRPFVPEGQLAKVLKPGNGSLG